MSKRLIDKPAKPPHRSGVQPYLRSAAVQKRHLSLLQETNPEILAIVRDLLLEGNDVDAIAILAHELDMQPRPKRLGIWPLIRRDVAAGGYSELIENVSIDGFKPLRFGVTEDTGANFSIHGIVDLARNMHLIEGVKVTPARIFTAVKTHYSLSPDSIEPAEVEGRGVVALRFGSGYGTGAAFDYMSAFGMPLPFPLYWNRGEDAVRLSFVNESDRARDFVGFIVGSRHDRYRSGTDEDEGDEIVGHGG